MASNAQHHNRRSIRLKGYDYSKAGLYFITICTQNREYFFGEIVGATVGATLVVARMKLNDAGKMIETEWLKLSARFTNIKLHEYVVMPNHFHGIIQIVGKTVGATIVFAPDNTPRNPHVGAPLVGAQNNDERARVAPTNAPTAPTDKTIGDIMDAYKSITTVEYIGGVKNWEWQRFNGKLWQRDYYEHIIRNQQSYQTISEYIINNPAKWKDDKFFG